ncbi:GDSL esterase/lipase 5-like protein [Trifolium pratense]|uniref:GDSL esterase/lipase 5-like protein n=2 Tax=Trifolium pratense TaxID=57577 RepID=A0A2K3P6E7_TRIPR|nr:GDSL esterase/lipase 5-like protein [Trifolium pratense]
MVNLNSLGCFVVHIAFITSLSFSTSQSHINEIGNDITNNALFIFGDSTVDSGNNNFIDTIPENKADYKPYGQNGVFHEPTGRFSDGRVITDFIAEYAKLPLLPPFLEPCIDYSNGVNFASGGAGVLAETNQGLVIDLPTQLRNFEEVRKSLSEKLGEQKANELISEAVYFISIGSNDYMSGYLGNPKMQEKYNPEQYVGIVIGNLTQAIQTLYEKGARKFGFLSLSPLGCLPALRAANPDEATKGGCFGAASSLALAHNNALSNVLISLNQVFKGFMYSNSNFYDWLQDKIKNPTNYGFKDGINACCGTGPYGGIYTCGGTKEIKEYNLCDNVEEFLWWDSFHPTEKIHEQFAKALWNGPSSLVGPYNLERLFNNDIKSMTIADVVDVPEIDHGY